jgi:CTP synthase
MLLLSKSGSYDIIITELGGTVGDIESLPFIEAVRQLQWELPEEDCLVIHLTLVPYLKAAKELKTKPTQHSVRTLQQNGVHPDVIICRTEYPLPHDIRRKVALFCNVRTNAVIESIDAKSIYEVPLNMYKEKLDEIVLRSFSMEEYLNKPLELSRWTSFLERLQNPKDEINIALVGKYVELQDAYKSILESFIHAGAENECKVNVIPLHSEYINENNVTEKLKGMHGVLVAPGFGERGTEGKISSVKYVRENRIPFFGICLGMQMAVVEFARNVLKLEDAMTTEIKQNALNPVIDLMEDQKSLTIKGGTMRLGAYSCRIEEGSLAYSIYGKRDVLERHRHRYEVNDVYVEALKEGGLVPSGNNPDTGLVEIMEIKDHPFFIGVQFHPELKSTPENPQPIFVAFVKAALKYKHEISA